VIEPIYGELLTTVQCSNKYDKNKHIYKIKWDNKSVESSKTPTDVTLDQLSIQSYINYCNQFQTNFWLIIIKWMISNGKVYILLYANEIFYLMLTSIFLKFNNHKTIIVVFPQFFSLPILLIFSCY